MSEPMDTLELQIEAKAKGANASLTGMVKRLEKLSETLTKVQTLTAGFDKIANLNFSSIDAYRSELKGFAKELKGIYKNPVKPKVDRSDLNNTFKTLSEIKEKFKEVGKNTDFFGLSQPELDKQIKKTENKLKGLQERLNEKLDTENVDSYGKSYVNLIYKIQKAENELEKLKQLSSPFDPTSLKNMKIQRWTDEPQTGTHRSEEQPVDVNSIVESAEKIKKMAQEAKAAADEIANMKMELGGVSEKIPTGSSGKLKEFAEKIKETFLNVKTSIKESTGGKMDVPDSSGIDNTLKRIQREIAITKEAIRQAFSTGDLSGVEDLSGGLKQLEKSQRAYTKLRESVYGVAQGGNALTRAFKSIGSIGEKANSLSKSFDKAKKSIASARKTASRAIHPFRTLKELISGQSGNNNGMSFGRMIGSSIMFSSIFGAISAIKQAVKEGSDNLVQYSDSYNKSISGMVSSLLYLKNAWAVAFAPIVNVVAPYISAFIDMVAKALNTVGQFTAALTGKGYVVQAKKAWKDYGASIADAGKNGATGLGKANDAAKKLQKSILGFDELNVLNSNDNSGSTTGSGTGNGSTGKYTGPTSGEMFETIQVPDSMSKLAEKFKEAVKNSDFTEIGAMIGDKLSAAMEEIQWNKVYQHAENFGTDIATFLNGLISPRLFYNIGSTIANSINTALHAANAFAIKFDWKNLGESLASSIKGFFKNWDAGLTGATFGNFVSGIIEAITGFVKKLNSDETFKDIGEKLVDLICGVNWGRLAWDFVDLFSALADALVKLPKQLIEGIAEGISKNIFGSDFAKSMKENFLEITSGIEFDIPDALLHPFETIKEAASLLIDEVVSPMIDAGKNAILGFCNGVLEQVKGFGSWIKENILNPFVDRFKDAFGIHSPSTVMYEIGEWILPGFLNAVKDGLANVINWFASLPEKIKESLGNAKDWLVEKGKGAIEGLKNGWEAVKNSQFLQKAQNLKDEAFTALGDIAGRVKQKGSDLISGIKTGYEDSKQSGLLSKVSNLKNDVFSSVGDITGKLRQKGIDIVSGIKNGYEQNKYSIKSAVSGIPNLITSGIGSLYNIGRSVISSFANGFASIHIPMPHIGWDWNTFNLGNFSFSVPSFNLRWYAKGGFPEMGEMFIAGEKGPEMVGQIGKKNAVANNNQITSAIKDAVIDGMMQVFMATNSNKSEEEIPYVINAVLRTEDNEILARAVEKGRLSRDGRMNPSPAY